MVWRSSLLAVAVGYRKRGIGQELKRHLINEATDLGVLAITSMVRWDNIAMRALNRKFNGSEFPIPRDDGPDEVYCWSIVPVPERGAMTRSSS
jgi:GNAT superfamily N-acetyltransferase